MALQGWFRQGSFGCGMAWQSRHGSEGRGKARRGEAGMEVQRKEVAMSTATLFDLEAMPPILFVQDVPAGGWPPQIVMYDDSPRVRESDPLTSHAAADSNDVPRSHALVMGLFANERWLAQFEAEQLLAGILSPSRVRTAFTELEEAGRLTRTAMTMPTPYGRTAQVWEATK